MQNLIEVVKSAAEAEGGGKVKAVHLKIGRMSGVNAESLRFAFDILSEGTAIEGGRLEIEMIPLKIHCGGCSGDFNPQQFTMTCPSCGSRDMAIVSGREMEVDYILLEDGKTKAE